MKDRVIGLHIAVIIWHSRLLFGMWGMKQSQSRQRKREAEPRQDIAYGYVGYV